MTTILSTLSLIEFSLFFCHDLRTSKGNHSKRFWIRIVSAVSGILCVLSENILIRPCTLSGLGTDIASVTAILLIFPCSYEKPGLALRTASFLAVSGLAVILFFGLDPARVTFRLERLVVSGSVCLLVVMFYFIAAAWRKFSSIRALFRNNAVWHGLEDYSRSVYSVIFLCISSFGLLASGIPGNVGLVLAAAVQVCLLALYAILYLRAVSGRTLAMSKATEDKIKDMIKGNLRTNYIEKTEEDKKMNNLYKRIMTYMTESKPYLDPSFNMPALAEKMYTNKFYLSKTINILSGRNFRQFVNYHRIQYAIGLFKSDPRLKVAEVAEFSGFSSSVSFNMAFKINTGKTPSAWVQDYVSGTDAL
jgi:AraC-like DNA-binding protein